MVGRLPSADWRVCALQHSGRPLELGARVLCSSQVLATARGALGAGEPEANSIGRCSDPLRALTVVENYTRESLAIEVGQSLKGEDVVRTLERITASRSWPGTVSVPGWRDDCRPVPRVWHLVAQLSISHDASSTNLMSAIRKHNRGVAPFLYHLFAGFLLLLL